MNGDDPDPPISDWEKKQWQEEQLARDVDCEKRKIKDQKARIRRARSAQRQLKKARQQLQDLGEITDWEDEFINSVDERLEKYDSAFHDLAKGSAADALSMRQKQVLSQMRRKIKDKGKQAPDQPQQKQWRSSFKNKNSGFKPRVRHLEDEMGEGRQENPEPETQPLSKCPPVPPPIVRKPFLKIIKGGKD